MSVRVMGWVWQSSRSKGTDRLVLLAIADCAADDGGNAYPSMAALVAKTGLTDRGIQKSMIRLKELGELKIFRNTGPHGCNRYKVVMVTPEPGSPPNVVHPEPRSPLPEQGSPPPPNRVHHPPEPRSPGTVLEPSVEPSVRPKSVSSALAHRPDVEKLCAHLADRIVANGSRRPNITKSWHDAARLMIDNDGRTVDQIMAAIDWCQSDDFWHRNVLSMPTLRRQYERLKLAAKPSKARASPRPSTTDQRVAAGLELADQLDAIGASPYTWEIEQ